MSGPWDRMGVRKRLVALTGLLASVVALGLIIVVQLVLAGNAKAASEQVLTNRAAAVARAAGAASTSRQLKVPAAVLEPGVVVYDDTGAVAAGVVPEALSAKFTGLADRADGPTLVTDEKYAIFARPFTTSAGPRGTIVVAEPLTPYEHDEHAAFAVSIAAGLLMVLLAIGAAAWISRQVLAPVATMARTAEEWSEHDLERRFALGPPGDEIRALGHTLDGLLDKVANAIRTEQRLTSELAHELRTPLTTISGIAQLVSMRPDLDDELREDVLDIQRACRGMSSTVRVLMDLARGARPDSMDSCTTEELTEALVQHYREQPGLVVDLAPGVRIAAPLAPVVRALIPVVDNALQAAEHVEVSSRPGSTEAHPLVVVVRDDGPGIPTDLVDDIFEPGVSSRGSGLGLALARRVARSVGAEVDLEATPAQKGTTFLVRLPTVGVR